MRDSSTGINAAVAAVLRAERAARTDRMTVEQLADASGVPLGSLHRYLNGQRSIKINVLAAVCGVLDIAPSWVLEQAYARLEREQAGVNRIQP